MCEERGLTFVDLLLILLVVSVVGAFGFVSLERARRADQESRAVDSLRAIHAAQSAYASSCAGAGFAQSLDDLARPPAGAAQAYLTPDLSQNGIVSDGYAFTMRADTGATIVTPTDRVCNQPRAHAMSGYFVSAVPDVPETAGRYEGFKTFAIDKRGIVYTRDDGVAISPGMYGAVPIR